MCDVHTAGMAIKNISLKREAYDRLKAARRYPEESFSEVVLRATWPEDTLTAGDLLRRFKETGSRLPERMLDRIDTSKRSDTPPEDKWAKP